MRDFREIERKLARFFEGEGISASVMDGDLYLGVVETRIVKEPKEGGGETTIVGVPVDNPAKVIVPLTRLARELAEAGV